MHTHTSPDPVGILQVAIYAQGAFHLNTWKMKSPVPGQLECILNNRSILRAAIVNDTVLHQALCSGKDPCSTTLLAIRGDQDMLSTTDSCHSRVVASDW